MPSTERPDEQTIGATIKVVTDHAPRILQWDYTRGRDQLVTLYNKAMGSQWNSVTELDRDTDVDPERLVNSMPEQTTIVALVREAGSIPVPNVRKLGLLDANNGYLRSLWADAGLLGYELADDTAENYDEYDAVAQDRARSRAAS